MRSQIVIYQEIGALSAGMVEAASNQDWERLVELEGRVSVLRDALVADGDNAPLDRDEASLKAALIRQILQDDAEIRRHTEPWMEHVRQFLGNTVSRRRVNSLYGGGTTGLLGGAPR